MTNFVLVPLHGGNLVPIDKAIIFLGRGSECDIVLTDSRKVSRKHCCVAQIDHRIMVRDLGSTNGVRINEKVTREESELPVGGVLWIGDLGFRLELAETQGLKAPTISKRVPIPSRKKEKTSPEYPSHEVDAPPPAARRRPRSSKSFPVTETGTSGQEVEQVTSSDMMDAAE